MALTPSRRRRILSLALPIMGGMASQNLLNLVDTAFVGRLGKASLAAVGMGGFANWLLIAALLGLGAGVQAMAARRKGAGNHDDTAVGLNAALVLAMLVGIPVAILGEYFAHDIFRLLNDDPQVQAPGGAYLSARFIAAPFAAANFAFRGYWNGTDRSKNYMMTLVVMHVVNVALDWVLIFGHLGAPAMGVAGAGWATSLSLMVGTGLYFLLGMVQARSGGFLRWRGTLAAAPTILRLAIPASMQQFAFSAGFVAFFVIAGKIGTEALAASNVLVNLMLLCVLPGVGLGISGATLVGQALGCGDFKDSRDWGDDVIKIGAALVGLIGLTLALGARTWLGIFIVDEPHTLEMAVLPLVVLGLGQWLDSVGVMFTQMLIGIGDTVAMLRISLIGQWLVFLPSAWLLCVVMGGGLMTLWGAMVVWRLGTAVACVIRWRGQGWQAAQA
ncbi:MAG: MATE family efflux transporter [Myxococcales bacterium]|nr:MATE family efflux transporter [Myxococcales bacterium]